MEESDVQNKVSLEHTGDHHHAKITIDPKTKQVIGGVVHNFSNNSAIALSIDENGKVEGTAIHSGDTHGFQVDVKSNGSFGGTYIDHKRGIELVLSGDKATLTKGKIAQAGLSIEGDHHKAQLKLEDNGKISGILASRISKEGIFKMEIQNGKIVGGAFVHAGAHHKTQISVGQDGWRAGISIGTGKSKWSINIEKGKAQTKIFGGLKMKF